MSSKNIKKVGFLTAGGLAPCLSSSLGYLIDQYNKTNPDIEMIGYINGYKGLLLGDSIEVTQEVRDNALVLTEHGGSPLGNSRVKLTNVDDCVKRGLVQPGQDPLKVAADQLVKDGVDVLHTIGGDDTSLTAADLAAYLAENDYELIVVGLPKTVDNDVYPIAQSLGAWTAAKEGAKYFQNVVKENSANPNMFVIHEVMGRNCGYLTGQTAIEYRKLLKNEINFLPEFMLTSNRQDVHAVYVPEMTVDIDAEAARLKKVMEENDCVNIFVSEGACVKEIIAQMKEAGEEVPMDAFGHPRLDKVNPGEWFGKQFASKIGAEKVLVQKSGYFSRAAAPCKEDLDLIHDCCVKAVECALNGQGGVVGQDENKGNEIRACEFERIAGGKPYNVENTEFQSLLKEIGQIN